MNIGDFVARHSYGCDIIFKIQSINTSLAILEGVFIRIIADAHIEDLVLIPKDSLEELENKDRIYEDSIIKKCKDLKNHITGRILHVDSDPNYLIKCLNLYKELGIYAKGINASEYIVESIILDYIKDFRPNVIILTGHDSYNKKGLRDLNNYRNTKNFMKSLIQIRKYYSLDDICVFAGACGSNFEALIASGANFASSCNRLNIEAYDPAIVGVLACITPFNQVIDINELYNFSRMEKGSIGGIETNGKMRLLKRT